MVIRGRPRFPLPSLGLTLVRNVVICGNFGPALCSLGILPRGLDKVASHLVKLGRLSTPAKFSPGYKVVQDLNEAVFKHRVHVFGLASRSLILVLMIID